MMEIVLKAAALCVAGALLALVLKKGSPELALLLTIAAAAVVLLSLADILRSITTFLRQLGTQSGMSDALFVPLYKTVGIALVVRIGSCLCRDAGESALASVVETAGALCALTVSLPLLQAVLSLLLELM